jgi:hypothetical protein
VDTSGLPARRRAWSSAALVLGAGQGRLTVDEALARAEQVMRATDLYFILPQARA